jgi:hypothetical protein
MSSEYEKFTNNEETVIIKPGEEFSMNELKQRLKLMGIDAGSFQNKSALINYYDTLIKLDEKKLKIMDKLKHDTEIYEFTKIIRKNKTMMQIPINGIMNKEMNIQHEQTNKNVQLKRANRITEDSIKNSDSFPLLFDNSENVGKEKNVNKKYKILRQVVYHTLFGFITISLALLFLYIYRIYSEEINKIISLFLGRISNFNINWLLTAFILIFAFVFLITKLIKKNKISKRCKEIIKKIKKDNEGNNEGLTDEEIYRKYVENYGVNYELFKKSYLPILKKFKK